MSDVELGWLERDLRALDRASGDVLVGGLFDDERPPRGALGLFDWRADGKLSQLCLSGFLSGARGERFLYPVRPRLAFDLLLVIGLGPRGELDEAVFRDATAAALDALSGLKARRAVIDLPGRHAGALAAPRALELLNEVLGDGPRALESLVVIDDREAQRAVEATRVTRARRSHAARR